MNAPNMKNRRLWRGRRWM